MRRPWREFLIEARANAARARPPRDPWFCGADTVVLTVLPLSPGPGEPRRARYAVVHSVPATTSAWPTSATRRRTAARSLR